MFFFRPFLISIFVFSLLALKVTFFLYVALIAMLLSIIFTAFSILLLRKFNLIDLPGSPDFSFQSFFYLFVNFSVLYCIVSVDQMSIPIMFFLLQCFYIFFIPHTKVVNSIAKNRKMSAIILEFAQPWLDQCETFQEEKDVLTLSVSAWNLSLSKGQTSKKLITSKLKKAGINTINGKPVIGKLIEKRRKKYAEYAFEILNFSYIEKSNGSTNLTVLGCMKTDT